MSEAPLSPPFSERYSDEELRLECARLAAVFTGSGDVAENAQKLYEFIRREPQQ